MHAPITLLYGSIAALLTTLLGSTVSLARLKERKFVGDAVDGTMLRLVRAHGNSAEWTALGIVMLFLVEVSGGASQPLHVLGGLLVTTRMLHAAAMIGRLPFGVPNAVVHYLVFTGLAGYGLYLRWAALGRA
jgi:uncharacterized protein